MTPKFLTQFDIARQLSCPPHLTNVSTLPCKTRSTSFVGQLSRNPWWCLLPCPLWEEPAFTLLTQEWKSIESTIVKCCWPETCCQISDNIRNISSSSRIERPPPHRARETVELLKKVTPDFIPPSLRPPNSPDLNPVDYAIWGIMQERIYNKGKIANVDELRQRIVDEWERLDQQCIIDGAVIEGMAITTASVCCCCCWWRRTVWTWTVTRMVQQCCCILTFRLIVWLLIKFAVTVFSVLWLFQSHAAVVKRYNAFCVKLTANSDTKQNNISKSTFPVHVSKHIHI